MTPRRLAVLLLPVLASAACGAGVGPERATGRFASVHTAVCASATAAEGGDEEAARRAFDDAHTGLHDLAAAVGEQDRSAARRLLEAKQRVETRPDPPSRRSLVEAVAQGIVVTGGSAPDRCPDASAGTSPG